MPLNYADRLARAVADRGTPAVVGIDPVLERLPEQLRPADGGLEAAVDAIEAFCRIVIDRVAPHVPAVKINSGFLEVFYELGVGAYYRLVAHAHTRGLLVIGDIKRGDIGSTAKLYTRGHLASPTFADVSDERIPDAVTLAGYLGENAVKPFIEAARETGRGMYVLVRPSDPGADLVHEFGGESRFYQHMAALVGEWGRADGLIGECGLSCVGAVVAAKDVDSTRALRESLPTTPFLVPGYGAQGGTADTCRACFRSDGSGAVVNASRSVIYAFNNHDYLTRFRDDWAGCIEQAAQDFAKDVARLMA